MFARTWPLTVRIQLWVLVAPALAIIVGFYIFPVARILWISVTVPTLGFGNYELLVTSNTIANVIANTVRVSLLSTVITLVSGYIVAYAIVNVGERQRQKLLFCVLLPFWLSVLVRAFAWVMLLSNKGLVNEFLLGIGVIHQPLTLVRNEFGVIVGMVHYMLPYAILLLCANMLGIDKKLVAAARGLGASPASAFLRVFLPLSRPGIISAAVLVFALSLGFYVTPTILGGGKMVMLSEYIGFNILHNVRWELAAMLASSLLATIVLLLAVVSRFFDIRRLFGAT